MGWPGYDKYIPPGLIRPDGRVQRTGKAKYGNRKTSYEGLTFDSAKECRRWQELKMLEKAGEIHGLQRQFKMRLCAWRPDAGVEVEKWPRLVGYYVADFVYCTHDVGTSVPHAPGTCVVEDAKGFKTQMYQWKKRHVEAQYGIEIREV